VPMANTLPPEAGRIPPPTAALHWGISLLIAASLALPLASMFGNSGVYLTHLADDFYYYAIIANHIVAQRWSTFDGIATTNGYQPLWMGVLVLIRCVTGGLGPTFFCILSLIQGVLCYLFFRVLHAFGRELYRDAWFTAPIAIGLTALAIPHFLSGMEEALAIPLFTFVLLRLARMRVDRLPPREAAGLGLLCSVLVLSRLDSILLPAILLASWLLLARVGLATRLSRTAAFAAGGVALPIYLVANKLWLGSMMPISGQAKQLLRHDPGAGAHVLQQFLHNRTMLAAVAVGLLGAVLQAVARRTVRATPMPPMHRFAVATTVLFPVLFVGMYAMISDWRLWSWYRYWQWALAFVLLGWFCTGITGLVPARRHATLSTAATAITAIAALAIVAFRAVEWHRVDPDGIYAHARKLEEFARAHPGRYAMGDRAGLTAYVLKQPFIQLEGIVSDRAMIGRIRSETPLRHVLADYEIDYLIVSVYSPLRRGAAGYHVRIPDPVQAGWRSCRMEGDFPSRPVYFYTYYGRCFSYVFDCRVEAGALPRSRDHLLPN
jgi:hypothetical protein